MNAEPSPVILVIGCLLCYTGLAVSGFFALAPRPTKNSINRDTASNSASSAELSLLTVRVTGFIEGVLKRRNRTAGVAGALEAAGLKFRPAEFVLLVVVASVLAAGVGLVIGGAFFSIVLALTAPFAARFGLRLLASRRRKQFADQLDDTLQLLAGGLRAGHSLLRAIDAVSGESESPTSEEFTRIINETRLGRDLGEALEDTATRTQSEDFSWVAQAMAIHREVGGNLADVLDQVGHTIRERNQIRRQVKALSAEGKISAIVLMVLPFGLGGILLVISPGYMNPFVETPIGLVLMGVSAVLLTLGALWLRKVVSFKF
ncbi:type II secretion system F family protein [Arthrobacter sp. OAP107]|uniref:type II secretion system F family protein n=1 Tax=Arthrobacter sp. OAP107 TaxID=3156445 RepID=UPI003392DD4C